ncbi:histidine phosphatase family protein [Chitinasiproducens palmae]|uniref:Histidine phosphatase family protein n=1 Tax=Chitinasiproducens palmae TaxID=1770053 RepID=A0A1H2PP51_9BURK|nr:histidine phosphatase family protein [Chitinasiproducens palmae]SDV48049.1 hypothetical protein SAMN05216551_104118 [Chitinasiproducens palmae]
MLSRTPGRLAARAPRTRERWRTRAFALCVALSACFAPTLSATAQAATQTIVLLRHAEKPLAADGQAALPGLGQLTCTGLQRARQLPGVLIGRFGRPDYVFSLDPAGQVGDYRNAADQEQYYYYVRPLMTIQPTAIKAGRAVNVGISFADAGNPDFELAAKLSTLSNDSTTFVAWEHNNIQGQLVQDIFEVFGFLPQAAAGQYDIPKVWTFANRPSWPNADFTRMYVIRINTDASGNKTLSFTKQDQGITPTNVCP